MDAYAVFFSYYYYFHWLPFTLCQETNMQLLRHYKHAFGAYSHLSCFARSSPVRHPCQSEDTWGVKKTKKKTLSASDPENGGHTSFTYFPPCTFTRPCGCCKRETQQRQRRRLNRFVRACRRSARSRMHLICRSSHLDPQAPGKS